MSRDKKSFFERLTGTVKLDTLEEESIDDEPVQADRKIANDWLEEDTSEGQLTVDVYQNATEIIIKTIVAGVRPEDLDISITRDMVVIKGHREEKREVSENDYFNRELYWGSFSRTIMLPEEIDVEEAEASSVHGLLSIRLPKINKQKQTKLKVKAS